MFSRRSQFGSEVNAYTAALDEQRRRGTHLIDLTHSNPTRAGFDASLYSFQSFDPNASAFRVYEPVAQGLATTRDAIADYYARYHGVRINPDALLLASGTSEAYRVLFDLLCDPGDRLLAPSPGYPLLDLLAQASGAEIEHYRLTYSHQEGWRIDLAELAERITAHTRGIVLITPGNPTGHMLNAKELQFLNQLCHKHALALIVDEVFVDYVRPGRPGPPHDVYANDVLTFVLNGLSKGAGLPQLKLSWILTSGPEVLAQEAAHRTAFLMDSMLSVSSFAQLVAPEVLERSEVFRQPLLQRIAHNLEQLHRDLPDARFQALESDGGWYQVLRVPEVLAGEDGAIRCLREQGVIVLPGYFFDFEEDNFIVISLLTPSADFAEGLARIVRLADPSS